MRMERNGLDEKCAGVRSNVRAYPTESMFGPPETSELDTGVYAFSRDTGTYDTKSCCIGSVRAGDNIPNGDFLPENTVSGVSIAIWNVCSRSGHSTATESSIMTLGYIAKG